jgi:hypothetical protein
MCKLQCYIYLHFVWPSYVFNACCGLPRVQQYWYRNVYVSLGLLFSLNIYYFWLSVFHKPFYAFLLVVRKTVSKYIQLVLLSVTSSSFSTILMYVKITVLIFWPVLRWVFKFLPLALSVICRIYIFWSVKIIFCSVPPSVFSFRQTHYFV